MQFVHFMFRQHLFQCKRSVMDRSLHDRSSVATILCVPQCRERCTITSLLSADQFLRTRILKTMPPNAASRITTRTTLILEPNPCPLSNPSVVRSTWDPVVEGGGERLFLEWIENKELIYDNLLVNDDVAMRNNIRKLEAQRPPAPPGGPQQCSATESMHSDKGGDDDEDVRLLEADIGELLEEDEPLPLPPPSSPPPSVKPASSFIRKTTIPPRLREHPHADRRSIASSRQRPMMPPPRRPPIVHPIIPDDDDDEFDIDDFIPKKASPPSRPPLQDDQTTLPLPDDNVQQQSEQMKRQNLLIGCQPIWLSFEIAAIGSSAIKIQTIHHSCGYRESTLTSGANRFVSERREPVSEWWWNAILHNSNGLAMSPCDRGANKKGHPAITSLGWPPSSSSRSLSSLGSSDWTWDGS